MDIADIIKRLGGTRPLARKLGLTPQRVHNWKKRNIIPTGQIGNVLRLAKSERRGIKAEDLIR